ncbi:MAG: class I SAM-dependent methyltransferase [Acidobacterium ailaaui]|nr:class I SAM-dependent methyltransferase [Pseudacidobacterium ailaaui]
MATSDALATVSDDYTERYYHLRLGSDEPYDWSSLSWRTFFTNVAQRIVSLVAPRTVLDVGCAKGLLVRALRNCGVDAYGIDISEAAINSADPEAKPYLSIGNATRISGHFDVITCIEVLEHMRDLDADQAIDQMCQATDLIIFSSTPSDYAEPTHINVKQPHEWAAAFAERGFYRRTDVDLSFLSPWAMLLQRLPLTQRDLVYRYEERLYPLEAELTEKRAALLECNRRLAIAESTQVGDASSTTTETCADLRQLSETQTIPADNETSPNTELLVARIKSQESLIRELRDRLLASRDHAIGAEAEAAQWRLRFENERRKCEALYASRTYRIGRVILWPVALLRRLARLI